MCKITPFYNNSDKIYVFIGRDIYMKYKKICPKCSSSDIIMIPGNIGAYGSGNNIHIGLTSFSAVLVHRYLCCNCGYSEEWINKKDIPTLKKKFQSK